MRTILRNITLFAAFAINYISYSQEVQWAKNYSGSEPTIYDQGNAVMFSAFDSQGNIYILGSYGNNAVLDGDTLQNQPTTGRASTIIAKYDNTGNKIWSKFIRTNEASTNQYFPNGMQLVGDTSLAIMTAVTIGTSTGQKLYFLDTLLTSFTNNYPAPPFGSYTALLILDLDGNLIDRHFLQRGQYGNNEAYPTSIVRLTAAQIPFHIGKDGSFYLFVPAQKFPNNNNKFLLRIDGGTINYDFDFSTPLNPNCKIFKFSPDFTNLIWAKDFVVDTTGIGIDNDYFRFNLTGLSSDEYDNMFVTGYILRDYSPDTTAFNRIFDIRNNKSIVIQDRKGTGVGFTIKYDTSGEPQWVNQLWVENLGGGNNNPYEYYTSQFYNSAISEDNNIYALGHALFNRNYFNMYFNDSIPINFSSDVNYALGMFFVKYDLTTGGYLSHGTAQNTNTKLFNDLINMNTIYANEGHIVSQVLYGYGLQGIDTIFSSTGLSIGFVCWADNGSLIEAKPIFHHTSATFNECVNAGNTILNDNGNLFLTGTFVDNLNFEGTTLNGVDGRTNAFMIMYHDDAFAVPTSYIASEVVTNDPNIDTSSQTITLNGTILNIGNPLATGLGFIYGTDSTDLTNNIPVTFNANTTTFNYVLSFSEIVCDTNYYYKAYIANNGNTYYGGVKSFQCNTNGLNDIDDISDLISIFPNPATNELNIVSPVAIKQVEVLNLLGKVVYEQRTNVTSWKIDVSSLAKGNYFVKVYTDKGVVVRKLLIE